ncbi:MAG: hypothetical protein EXR77_10680 [Myxococcales bacterium]|nr:hypothetical protein [Myxococcales bacterium]
MAVGPQWRRRQSRNPRPNPRHHRRCRGRHLCAFPRCRPVILMPAPRKLFARSRFRPAAAYWRRRRRVRYLVPLPACSGP